MTDTTQAGAGPAREYVLLLHGDESVWANATEAEQLAAYELHGEFARLCGERGHRITGGAELEPAATSLLVRQEPGGEPQVTEGPFAETVEQLGGYYVIATADVQDLARIAGMLVTGDGTVELRPTVPPPAEAGAAS
ncbi:hypothetical protein GXB85_16000 [Cellulomonas sp. APG4]|uniref:YciI family protein n=1 Tax=Cellulomonas sp. APG4 TaxID=1538656 RepID=UPI001379E522|nr:YciI family protein [Cellulomonas sp. APG4]NCT92439.1 hypothetical protein [Cellulomonas sp. APG4]